MKRYCPYRLRKNIIAAAVAAALYALVGLSASARIGGSVDAITVAPVAPPGTMPDGIGESRTSILANPFSGFTGSNPAPAAVPEPGAMMLIVVGGVMLLRRRRVSAG